MLWTAQIRYYEWMDDQWMISWKRCWYIEGTIQESAQSKWKIHERFQSVGLRAISFRGYVYLYENLDEVKSPLGL
jgi:hypothetical protein